MDKNCNCKNCDKWVPILDRFNAPDYKYTYNPETTKVEIGRCVGLNESEQIDIDVDGYGIRQIVTSENFYCCLFEPKKE